MSAQRLLENLAPWLILALLNKVTRSEAVCWSAYKSIQVIHLSFLGDRYTPGLAPNFTESLIF